MSLRLLLSAITRRKGRVALGVLSILIGVALATSLLGLLAVSGERMARELKGYGANILVIPRSGEGLEVAGVNLGSGGALLDEGELARLKAIFWRRNILGTAPFLSLVAHAEGGPVVVTGTWFDHPVPLPEGGTWATGASALFPGWRIEGEALWDGDGEGALVGASLARQLGLKPGDRLSLAYQGRQRELVVRGILYSGGLEENQVLVDLPVAQGLAGVERGADRVLVSALTMPREKLSPDIRSKDPKDMTPEEYEKWYCSPIIEAVITQIEEVLPNGGARPIRQVSEAEASFLLKTELLVVLMTAAALAISALVVLTAMTAMVMERRREVGLMKALGAGEGRVLFQFLAEAWGIALVCGLAGSLLGVGLAWWIAQRVFQSPVGLAPQALVLTWLIVLGVTTMAAYLPVRRAARIAPAEVLKGE
ncbi:MAG: ABC transporter permease [Chloroflexota bacterium]